MGWGLACDERGGLVMGQGGSKHFGNDIEVRNVDPFCFCCLYDVADLSNLGLCEFLPSVHMVWLGGVPVGLFKFHDT